MFLQGVEIQLSCSLPPSESTDKFANVLGLTEPSEDSDASGGGSNGSSSGDKGSYLEGLRRSCNPNIEPMVALELNVEARCV